MGAEYCPLALLDIRYFRYLIRESPPRLAEIEAKNTRDFGSRIPFGITEPINSWSKKFQTNLMIKGPPHEPDRFAMIDDIWSLIHRRKVRRRFSSD